MNYKLVDRIKSAFLDTFNNSPILIFSPGRINFIGEHTDYNEGFALPAAINKGVIAGIEKSQTSQCSIIALDLNETFEFNLMSIQPLPNGGWKNYVLGVIYEIQKTNKKLLNFNLVFGSDIPIGAGLSSSAALENSIVFALNELFQLNLTKKEMIFISQKAEHNFVGVKCGIMDQYASMFGKRDSALLLDCRNITSTAFDIDFNNHDIILINTNVKHNLELSAYNDRRSLCESIARLLKIDTLRDATEQMLFDIKDLISEEDYKKASYIIQENNRVIKACEAIKNNDLNSLGSLLYASHEGLKDKYKVSCDELDYLVEATKSYNTIIGSRMMGGGFGGCTINLVQKQKSDAAIEAITNNYFERFTIKPSIYKVSICNGTKRVN